MKSITSGGKWHVNIHRSNDAGASVNGIEWKAKSYDEDGNSTPVDVREMGLGRYQVSVPLVGNRMALQLVDPVHGKMKTLQWNRAYPHEYRRAHLPGQGYKTCCMLVILTLLQISVRG